jgi:hypothetical protein
MIPAKYDFTVVRGTSGPTQGLTFRLKATDALGNLVNISYEDVRLSIYKRKDLILRASLNNGQIVVNDIAEAELAWVPTYDDTRLIPEGLNKSHYELEVWNAGTQVVYMMGNITGLGGINDDEEVS